MPFDPRIHKWTSRGGSVKLVRTVFIARPHLAGLLPRTSRWAIRVGPTHHRAQAEPPRSAQYVKTVTLPIARLSIHEFAVANFSCRKGFPLCPWAIPWNAAVRSVPWVPMPAKHDQRMLCRWPTTIWDVARAAGVSVSTVSKALNGRGQLRKETRSLVQSAAERLNFRPNNLAQSLLVASIWRASGGFGLLT